LVSRALVPDTGAINQNQLDEICRMLLPGERVHWVGRPTVPFAPTIGGFLFSQFLLSFSLNSVLDEARGWFNGEPIDSIPWFALLYAASLLFGAFGINRAIHASRTTFALTSMRAIYLSNIISRKQYAVVLHPSSKVTIVPCLNGRQDLMIEAKQPGGIRKLPGADGPPKQVPVVTFNSISEEQATYLEGLAHEVIDRLEYEGRYQDRFYIDPYIAAR
jgi:hypothetical protein